MFCGQLVLDVSIVLNDQVFINQLSFKIFWMTTEENLTCLIY